MPGGETLLVPSFFPGECLGSSPGTPSPRLISCQRKMGVGAGTRLCPVPITWELMGEIGCRPGPLYQSSCYLHHLGKPNI